MGDGAGPGPGLGNQRSLRPPDGRTTGGLVVAATGRAGKAGASDPVSAHAATRGDSRGSSTVIAGASSSYPVRESSGKATTRVPAARTIAACVTAFTPTS